MLSVFVVFFLFTNDFLSVLAQNVVVVSDIPEGAYTAVASDNLHTLIAVSLDVTKPYASITSIDGGSTWRYDSDSNLPRQEWEDIDFKNNDQEVGFLHYVAAAKNDIYWSPDGGNTWIEAEGDKTPTAGVNTIQQWRKIAYYNGIHYVIAASQTTTSAVAYSINNGQTWVAENTPSGSSLPNQWSAVCAGPSSDISRGMFVAVARCNAIFGDTPDPVCVMSTTRQRGFGGNGWTIRNDPSDTSLHQSWMDCVHGGAGWVAVGASSAMHSSDGETWTTSGVSVPSKSWISVTFGNGLYVALARDGALMQSADGLVFTELTTPEAAQSSIWSDVAFVSGNVFVAVAKTGANPVMRYESTVSPGTPTLSPTSFKPLPPTSAPTEEDGRHQSTGVIVLIVILFMLLFIAIGSYYCRKKKTQLGTINSGVINDVPKRKPKPQITYARV